MRGIALLWTVGTLLGAMTGALIGQETESGFVRGAAVGAISGAVFSIEVFEASLVLWQSDESGIECLLYLVSHCFSGPFQDSCVGVVDLSRDLLREMNSSKDNIRR